MTVRCKHSSSITWFLVCYTVNLLETIDFTFNRTSHDIDCIDFRIVFVQLQQTIQTGCHMHSRNCLSLAKRYKYKTQHKQTVWKQSLKVAI